MAPRQGRNVGTSDSKDGTESVRHCPHCKTIAAAYFKRDNQFRKAYRLWQRGEAHIQIHPEMAPSTSDNESPVNPAQGRLPDL